MMELLWIIPIGLFLSVLAIGLAAFVVIFLIDFHDNIKSYSRSIEQQLKIERLTKEIQYLKEHNVDTKRSS